MALALVVTHSVVSVSFDLLCRCRKGKKVYCSKAKVSCKKPTAKKPTYKKATPKKVEDHPHPEDHHGAGHTRKLQSADETEFEVQHPLFLLCSRLSIALCFTMHMTRSFRSIG